MAYSQSRWQRMTEIAEKRKAATLLAASGIILIMGLVFGIPAVFKLTSLILNTKSSGATIPTDPQFIPATPRISQEYEATKSAEIKITGVADPKTIVELFQNGNSNGTTISNESGQFSFSFNLSSGENIFTAHVLTLKNTKSYLSQAYTVYLLTKNPKLELDSLKDVSEVKDNPVSVTGTTDQGVVVTINDHFVFVDTNGVFKYSLNLQNGDNKVSIVARDKAGNESKKEITI